MTFWYQFLLIAAVCWQQFVELSDVVSAIDSNQLFIIRIGWEQGGGHFVVGSGYDHVLNEIFIVNPKPESECKYYEYIELVRGTKITGVKGSWTDTIYY